MLLNSTDLWVISQNLESPPYNTKEYCMGDFFIHLRAKSYEINV